MKMPPLKSLRVFEAWSFSRLSGYEKCPLQAVLDLNKIKTEAPGPALIKGSEIHEHLSRYLQKFESRLRGEVIHKSIGVLLRSLRKLKKGTSLRVEQQWAFKKNWMITEWFASDAWCRMVVDVAVAFKDSVRVVDFKTGKIYASHDDQLGLYALGSFMKFPEVNTVTVELWYTDIGATSIKEYDRSSVQTLQKYWEGRAKPMLKDRKFAPRPGGYCRWCLYSTAKGGPCRF